MNESEYETENARVHFILTGLRLGLGRLYIWGGDDVDEGGYDCSGFVSEALTELSLQWNDLYDGQRRSSRGLHTYFREREYEPITHVDELRPGSVVFYCKDPEDPMSIFHVSIHMANVKGDDMSTEVGPVCMEFGGGGSRTTSPRAALQRSAGFRLSDSDGHGGAYWMAFDPFEKMEDPWMA